METNQDDVLRYWIEREERKGAVLDALIVLITKATDNLLLEEREKSHEESR